ncbi:diguanylate cyclase [Duganella sp. BJB488]|uniref:ligand-binding sensor domain-containing diguanylate cyclase n=2 Tax=Duganella TaxID=75654 RepID=UPI000E340C9E|nr:MULTISPECIES: diguanylate cyclase [unclassified Duganella]RFP17806.1 diguanylate cyclase [Duganella sp. BJB489]RFP22314.1 diguanylate cyclase [Duganella sp. BJB488]RFP37648.1 diguanylate cyclase [Duganella sp. BJB480]
MTGIEAMMDHHRSRGRPGAGRALRRRLALTLTALLAGGAAHAQQLPLRSYGQVDGLANLTVTALAQDRTGFLWAGTENGLYRFDGSRFRRFGRRQDAADTSVTSLFVDPAGRLWIGTDRALLLRDGQQLRPVPRLDGKPFAVKPGLRFAAVDADHLLVQSNGRLQRVEPDGHGGWRGAAVFSDAQIAAQPGLRDLGALLRDADGTLWLGCGKRVCRYRDGVAMALGAERGLPPRHWDALLRDAAGTLWVGGPDRVLALAPGAQRFVDRTPPQFGDAANGWPVTLAQNSDGQLIAASDRGLFRAGAGGWTVYGAEQGIHFGSGVHPLLFDRDGDLWLGSTGRGLVQWQGYRHWESWSAQQGVPDDDVWSILRARDGTLYAGTGRGLARLDGGRFAGVDDGGQWGALAEDAHGRLWAGSFSGLLLRRDGRAGRGRVVARLPERIIYKLLFDDAGRLWIGTDRGLYLIADPDHAAAPRRVEAADALLGPDGGITGICRDGAGRLWFSGARGLLRLERGNWSRPLQGNQGFEHLACDGETLWLGESHGSRVWRADAADAALRLRPFPLDLLDGRLIQSLLVDRRHWLWLTTDSGAMVWNGSRWRLFNQQSGMVWNDANQNAIHEDLDGSLWIGTSNGLSHLLRPQALFGEHVISLEPSSVRYGGAALAGPAPWSGAALDVRVAAPLYQNHEALSFRYRLLGQEEAWSVSGNGELRYAALAAGRYRLQVVADDAALQASSPMLELAVVIEPPWWRTPWAYAGGAVLALGAIGLLHRYRVARVLRQQALLERRVAERTAALEASREEHRLRSLKDGLTQAWNRTALTERLTQMAAPGGAPFLLVLLDLDHFKRVNDTYGHLAGDEVLCEVVRRAQAQLRASDTVGRYGGEEFMLLLPGLDAASGGARLAQLHQAIGGAPVRIDPAQALSVTCSCGVVEGRPGALAPEQWIGLADQALYRAKGQGRNRIEYTDRAEVDALLS